MDTKESMSYVLLGSGFLLDSRYVNRTLIHRPYFKRKAPKTKAIQGNARESMCQPMCAKAKGRSLQQGSSIKVADEMNLVNPVSSSS
mmetsp:Transcript_14400/g.17454  ORF Transcript_14400/g.17454 Transcript_14400/m.17454 type:complete len:87 (-) Transcript_14400:466-726(-)